MQKSSLGVIQSVAGEISGQVDGVLRLLTGLSTDNRFSNTSKPLFERIIHAKPYQESYGLYMIGLTDEKINVVSSDETEPPTKYYNLGYRDYMKKLYSTGKYQITDAFLAAADNITMNYTIAVPIFKDDKVAGSIFGSIYFQDIETILSRNSKNINFSFYLLGENNTIMGGADTTFYGKTFLEAMKNTHLFGCNSQAIDRYMREGKSGDCWEFGTQGLTYITYERITPTNWTLVYRVPFWSVLTTLLPVLCVKICFYILMCAAVSFLGQRYLSTHLAEINHLLNRMATMQKELFQSEQLDYNNLLELTQTGLTDQLTGLYTRGVLFRKMLLFTSNPGSYGAVALIDLDDLKRINDNFGHEGGDCALLHFSQVLKEYEQKYNGIAARYGGDEFVFILNAIEREMAVEIIISLCKCLNVLLTTKEQSFSIHGSLGISFYPEHGTKLEELICKADLALYSAKQHGKNQCAIYTDNNSL